jgi:paraquat-inducible protein B
MAEQDNSETPARTAAVVEYSRWPGWIWAVPIAALLVVGWLAFRYLSYHGVSITIQFDNAAGMKEQSTTVQYRGVRMGTVTRIALSKDGRHVTVTVDMNPGTNKYLRSGTRFWLKGMSPSLGNLSTLKAIMAGPTIIMAPGGGKSVRHFVGIDYRPVLPTPPALLHIYVMSFAGEVGQLMNFDDQNR